MYYECCRGPQTVTNSIRSAVSSDGGFNWVPEPGTRLQVDGRNFMSPRILFLSDGRCRLYCCERDRGIISASSEDGGLSFQLESGVRIAPGDEFDSIVAFAPEIFAVAGSGYVMYFAGYASSNRAYILRATSTDGLIWKKDSKPVIAPGPGGWDAAKCSEMCLIRLPSGATTTPRYRLLYEACDGTARNERGVWRIASATSSG
jgi:hypothetical protein